MFAVLCSAASPCISISRCRNTRRSASSARRVATLALQDQTSGERAPHVAVIGAGWAGWGATKALAEAGCRVTLLDAASDPTGQTPFLTPTGKPFEAGTRGFWKDYPNINALVGELGIDENDVFTPFLTSAFYSPDGLEATAPVFSGAPLQLPSPLGQIAASFDLFKRLPLSDRATMAGLLLAMLDFDRDSATFAAYDKMTAHELCVRFGLSKRLVDDFVRPTLLVGLFAPLELTSGAVMLELLYFYAFAHQDSFDVRWIKSRSISELLIAPLAGRLAADHDLTVLAGHRCEGLDLTASGEGVAAVRFKGPQGAGALNDVDAVVLAVGAKGMRAIVAGSPAVAARVPELAAAGALGSIDVITTRLWLDRVVPTPHPANVLSRFEGLRGAGGTFFMLDQLQAGAGSAGGADPAALRRLWAAADDAAAESLGSVVAADFYGSGAVQLMADEDIVKLLSESLLPAAVPAFGGARVVDSCVLRCPAAVSWFSPGSFASRPPLQTRLPGIVCAGDWVRLGEREHGAKGLCQERALVTGFEAANALLRGPLARPQGQHAVKPVRPDEPQVVAGRAAAAAMRGGLGLLPLPGWAPRS